MEEMALNEPCVRIRLLIAYDGTGYSGWQTQKNAISVQETIEKAFRRFFPSIVGIHGSSRTDTGVHAVGMVAHVDIAVREFKIPIERLALALNAIIPRDIRIVRARRCSGQFHARFDARRKQYRYQVWNDRTMNPLLRLHAWHVAQPLDLARMREAARLLPGEKNFKSFAATRSYEMTSHVRHLMRCDLRKQGNLITFVLEGDGFLYKMCRGIVGTLIQVGTGKFPLGEIQTMLDSEDRRAAGVTAPPHGLTLWKVYYK